MAINISESIRLLAREAYARRTWMVGGFAVIAVVTTVVGLFWPKTFTSYSTVYVEDQGVVAPLLQGAAVTARMNDRAIIAREVIYGRRLLNQVVKDGGWPVDMANSAAVDGVIEGLKKRTLVTNVGDNLVRIEYTDTDSKRAQKVAQRLAELFVSESVNAKSHESEAAYAFIDQQVGEYAAKLRRLEGTLNQFRTSNPDAEPGADVDSTRRVSELRDRLTTLEQDLREAEIRRGTYRGGAAGGTGGASAGSVARAEEYRRRIAELSAQLDTLRLTYKDTFPDVVRVKEQIRELQAALDGAEYGRSRVQTAPAAEADAGEIRRGLTESSAEVATLRSRIDDTRRLLQEEQERSGRVRTVSTQLGDLTREYTVNSQLYEDLLKRREAARVSMSLDRSKNAASIRVEEPAFLPHNSSGPSQALFASGGVLLGIVLPLGVLFGLQQTDPRVRHSSSISERLGLPVLGVVPHLVTPREGVAEARSMVSLGLVVLGTIIAVAALSAIGGGL
jgi:polysaccharide chain length determinant protein (PEP-CTERM system associated)